MKIALLGNTCQNNFSLMRYLRNSGVDAHLFLFSDEGYSGKKLNQNIDGIGYNVSNNPQYNPEWDTWEINKWSEFIHRLPVPNGMEAILGRPDKLKLRVKRDNIIKSISKFNIFIGAGITPSLFRTINKKLTIFYPYSTGIEWVNEPGHLKKMKQLSLESLTRRYIRKQQIEGIRESKIRLLLSGEGPMQKAYDENNISFTRILMPQYYNLENVNLGYSDLVVSSLIKSTAKFQLKIFSHMRQFWKFEEKYYLKSDFKTISKNNDWLVKGFHKFIKEYPLSKPVLIMVEWGKDTENTKKLIKELNLQNNIIWLPLLSRKQISSIISLCDIICGDFTYSKGIIYGSCAYEALGGGKPLMQTFNFDKGEYKKLFNHDPPEMMDVKSIDDIYLNIKKIYSSENFKNEIGRKSLTWFKENNGQKLTNDWITLIENSYKK